jgi:hypothetical protein
MTISINAGPRTEVHFAQWNEVVEEIPDGWKDYVTVTELEFFSADDAEIYLRNLLTADNYGLEVLRSHFFVEALALSPNISNDELIAQFATLLAQGLYRAWKISTTFPSGAGDDSARPNIPPLPIPDPHPNGPPSPAENKAVLVEFIEVVEQAGYTQVVTGAGKNSEYFQPAVARTDVAIHREGPAYQQFINLLKDVDGAAQIHPEYDRPISVKARVTLNGQPKAGESVVFSFKLKKGEFRPNLTQPYREGFGKVGGPATQVVTTDSDGWTPTVMFMLSAYAGDIFTLFAKGPDGKELKIGRYQVWRRFWYQITHRQNHAPPALTDCQDAYAEVFAQMLPTTVTELALTEQTAPKGTFYPEWMVRRDSSSTEQVTVVGEHNDEFFFRYYKKEKNKPVKGHLVMCDACWTPKTAPAAVETFRIHSNPSEWLTLNLDTYFCGLLKPSLTGEPLVIAGKWFQKDMPDSYGALTDENILIEPEGRTSSKQIKILLPPEAPDPNVYAVSVTLQLRSASNLDGYSTGENMVISLIAGLEEDCQQTIVHEFGHGFNQPPKPGKQNPSLPRHPMHYIPQNSHGSHCRTGATKVTPDRKHPEKFNYEDGSCVMFSGGSNSSFCSTCHPYMRLEGMKKLLR